MGERFQFYVITNVKNRYSQRNITAIHDQWCWGKTAVRWTANLVRKLELIYLGPIDKEQIDNFIFYVLSIRDYGDVIQFHTSLRLEGLNYAPNVADSNHGCAIIDATDQKNIKVALFDYNGKKRTVEEFIAGDERDIETDIEGIDFTTLGKETYINLSEEMQELLSKITAEAV